MHLWRVELARLLDGPPLPENLEEDRFPVREFVRRVGSGGTLRCGDRTRLDLTLWDAEDGRRLYPPAAHDAGAKDAEDALTVRLGADPLPYGLLQVLLGASVEAKKTAIIPAYLSFPWPPAAKEG